MAFGKNGQNSGGSSAMNFVGQNTFFEGNIRLQGSLRVDGEVKGNIISNDQLIVGVTGVIVGDIKVKTAIINGVIKGKVEVEDKIIFEKKANFSGELKASQLVIDEGTIFNGTCIMGNEAEIPAEMKVEKNKKKEIRVEEPLENI